LLGALSSARGEGNMTIDTVLAAEDWERAHAELVRIGKQKSALDWEEGRWLLVALRGETHRRLGFGSFAEYVERLLGYGHRTTEEKLRVAEALEHLPQVEQALQEGSLHWSAVRELTRVATEHTEADWICAARNKTVREIERLVSGRQRGDRPEDPAKSEARRHVLRIEVSAETLATWREAMAKLRRDAGGPLDDDAAILTMARHVLGGPKDEGRASYQVAMTACEHCGNGTQDGKGEAIPIERAIVEMAQCDAQVLGKPGARATQTIPPAIRRQVMRRCSGRCAVPGCRNATFVDVHHCDPREEGGSHDPERLVVLCAAHHRAAHRGRLSIEGRASEGFVFRHADGSEYGRIESPQRADEAALVFRTLRQNGFKETDARRAVEATRGHEGNLESRLRAALELLSARVFRVSDSARPTYVVGNRLRPRGRGWNCWGSSRTTLGGRATAQTRLEPVRCLKLPFT